MNHQKIYESIIQKAKSENRVKYNNIYYENHHILPRCLGGIDDKDNKVLLTAREHYVCHKLLTYIYKRNKKIANAFCRMTWDKKGNRNISSRDYAYARELKSLIPISEETRKKLKPSNERKQQLSEKLKGNKLHKNKKHSEKTKQKIREKRKLQIIPSGYHLSKETKDKISKKTKGRILSKETKQKISKANKGRRLSLEAIQKIKEKRKLQSPPTLGIKQSKEWIEKRMFKIRKSN